MAGVMQMAGQGIGGGISSAGAHEGGVQSQAIANYEAAVKLKEAENVLANSREVGAAQMEQLRNSQGTIKTKAAASGIRSNAGVSLVAQAENLANGTKNIGFGLSRARQVSETLTEEAKLLKVKGEVAYKQSKWEQYGNLVGAGGQMFGTYQQNYGRA